MDKEKAKAKKEKGTKKKLLQTSTNKAASHPHAQTSGTTTDPHLIYMI